MSIKEIPQILFAVFAGSVLYTLLLLIPVIGPLIAGITAGKISKCKPARGFYIGVTSGIIGFIFLISVAFPTWNLNLNFFVWWIFMIWNLVAIMLTGIGSMLGSVMFATSKFFSDLREPLRGEKEGVGFGEFGEQTGESSGEQFYEPGAEVYTFLICPRCGVSNPEDNDYCDSCGASLKGG
jgi:MFS family permease